MSQNKGCNRLAISNLFLLTGIAKAERKVGKMVLKKKTPLVFIGLGGGVFTRIMNQLFEVHTIFGFSKDDETAAFKR